MIYYCVWNWGPRKVLQFYFVESVGTMKSLLLLAWPTRLPLWKYPCFKQIPFKTDDPTVPKGGLQVDRLFWLHFYFFSLSFPVAVVTIFFAVELAKTNLPPYFDWILIAFIIFHLLFHLILQSVACTTDGKKKSKVNFNWNLLLVNQCNNDILPFHISQKLMTWRWIPMALQQQVLLS